jgi:hypothetical protein
MFSLQSRVASSNHEAIGASHGLPRCNDRAFLKRRKMIIEYDISMERWFPVLEKPLADKGRQHWCEYAREI